MVSNAGQGIEIGPVSLPMLRILLAVGFLRVLIRGETIAGGINRMDWLMVVFAGWLLFASFFHNGVDSGFIFSAGIVFNVGLVYYLTRVFCRTTDELAGLIKVIAILLVPVALEMVQEIITGRNLFSALFGGVGEDVVFRNERFRARGPFRQAILAGTVLSAQDLRASAEAGAVFAVSPGATPKLLEAGRGGPIPLLPGVATASELMAGLELGYSRFKFFPAEAAGGAAVLRGLAGPFPQARFCPTGGVSLDNARDYLSLPNGACVGGSWLAPEKLMAAGDWAGIEALVRTAVERLRVQVSD